MSEEFIVIDHFYKDPWAVRALAQNAEYAGKGELSRNVAGIESRFPFYSEAVVQKLREAVGVPIAVDPSRNAFGRFRLGLEADARRTRVHYDNTDWTAVVYLTPQEHCRGGTWFFRHKETGLASPPSEEQLAALGLTREEFDRKIVLRDSLDDSRWSVTGACEMKFNRCLLLRGAKYFHGSDRLFGDSFENGRLTHNFFFNEVRS